MAPRTTTTKKTLALVAASLLVTSGVAQGSDDLVRFEPPTSNYVDGACVENLPEDATLEIDLFPHKSASGAQFTATVSADYSLLWSVTYHGTYKVLRNALTEHTYVLYQCGTLPPRNLDFNHTLVRVPVTTVAVTSTTYLPFLEMIGERLAIHAYTSDFDYVSSPCLRRLHDEGRVLEAYDAATWSIDASQLTDVELSIADAWTEDQVPHPYVMTDTHEDSVLKTAEYVEVVGLFFNREREATEAINHIVNNYLCIREQAEELATRDVTKRVLWTNYWDAADGWSIAECPNWYCEIVAAAGGEVVVPTVEPAIEYWTYPYLSTAQVLEMAQDADVLISSGAFVHRDLFMEQAPHLGIFDAGGLRGYNDFYERRHVEPDAFLHDVAAALWGTTLRADVTDPTLKFLRDVVADDPVR